MLLFGIFLLMLRPLILQFLGKIPAAATTGPRPTSSTPAIKVNPAYKVLFIGAWIPSEYPHPIPPEWLLRLLISFTPERLSFFKL